MTDNTIYFNMRLWKCLLVLFMFCAPVFGDYCDFLRGDANSDGIINLSDVVAIGSGAQSNDDAADVDDNGSVNGLDSTALLNFLFNGGPPPALPYPNFGHDCTEDNLNLNCSVPNDKYNQTAGSGGITFINTNTWIVSPDLFDSAADGHALESCVGTEAYTRIWPAWGNFIDSTGYSEDRLSTGIQEIELVAQIYFHATPGLKCRPYPNCGAGTNEIKLDLSNAKVRLVHTNGSQLLDVTGSWDTTSLTHVYERDANCQFTGLDPWTYTATFTSNNLNNQLGESAAGSGIGYVVKAKIVNVPITYTNNGVDITVQEEFSVGIVWSLNYEWCDVQ